MGRTKWPSGSSNESVCELLHWLCNLSLWVKRRLQVVHWTRCRLLWVDFGGRTTSRAGRTFDKFCVLKRVHPPIQQKFLKRLVMRYKTILKTFKPTQNLWSLYLSLQNSRERYDCDVRRTTPVWTWAESKKSDPLLVRWSEWKGFMLRLSHQRKKKSEDSEKYPRIEIHCYNVGVQMEAKLLDFFRIPSSRSCHKGFCKLNVNTL
jgi:hypothetical protein